MPFSSTTRPDSSTGSAAAAKTAGIMTPQISLTIHIPTFHSNESRFPPLTPWGELRSSLDKVQSKKTTPI